MSKAGSIPCEEEIDSFDPLPSKRGCMHSATHFFVEIYALGEHHTLAFCEQHKRSDKLAGWISFEEITEDDFIVRRIMES